jgi:hypothetical protein
MYLLNNIIITTDSKKVNCSNSPERNSYYCKEHQGQDVNLTFKFNQDIISYKVNAIISNINKILDDIIIHDSFLDNQNSFLFLISSIFSPIFLKLNLLIIIYKEKLELDKPLWCLEKFIPSNLVNIFWNQYPNYNQTSTHNTNCLVNKDEVCNNKCRTKGVLLTAYNCGIICSYREILSSESLTQVAQLLLDTISNSTVFPKYIIYDNACHLSEYIINHNIGEKSNRGNILKTSVFVIDRLHIKNHVRENCHQIYNADLHSELFAINSVVCEEINYWFGIYKHAMKHMNHIRFNFFMYIIFNIYNDEKLKSNESKYCK